MSHPKINNIIYTLDRAKNDEANRVNYINRALEYTRSIDPYVTHLEKTIAILSAELVDREPTPPTS